MQINTDTVTQEAIRAAWDEFMPYIESDTPPDLTERDKQVREDEAWLEAAARYAERKAALDAAKSEAEQAKAQLLELAEHPSVTGGGVTVTRYFRKGAIDYRRAAAESGVNVEKYRKPSSTEARITTTV